MGNRNARRVVTAALAAGLIGVVVLVGYGTATRGQSFTAIVPAAHDILGGTEINAGGKPIGSVTDVIPIDEGRSARLVMKIDDADYWPLARDTTMEIRLGGTVSTINRYIYLTPGKDRSNTLSDGDSLASGAVKIPVDVDRLLNNFTPRVRAGLGNLIDNGAPVLDRGGPALKRALSKDKAPRVLDEASNITRDLTKDTASLRTLVSSTASVLTAADTATPELRVLLDGVAQTADAVADENVALRTTLSQFPDALRQTRTTLANAEVTLRDAEDLAGDLSPGIAELRDTVGPLRRVLANLREATPLGVDTLRTATRLGQVVPALKRLDETAPVLESLLDQAGTELDCIRPWTPELVGLGTSWGDFTSQRDTKDRMVHTNFQSFLPAPTTFQPNSAQDMVEATEGIEYGFPRPPGQLVDQAWFQPQCGVTKDSLDPSKDRESHDFQRNRAGG